MLDPNSFYGRLSAARGNDSPELILCVQNVVRKLIKEETNAQRPGMLLGKIQSGKTRGFLGIIADAFDNQFDIAIVLTKGTKTLSNQTMARFKKDFGAFLEEDSVSLFDIMSMPTKLTGSERSRKLIFVAKKQKDNLGRILKLFSETHPDLSGKRVLLVDDEADTASVRFTKKKQSDTIEQGRIADQMDEMRRQIDRISYLQVTATPYALYLQPDEYGDEGDNFVFLPKRPCFTELLPIHDAYIGGSDYFGTFELDDPRAYLYVEVLEEEQDTLRSLDGRSVREDRVFTNTKIRVFRQSLVAFISAAIIRRRQQAFAGERRLSKYAMVVHNDVQKSAHKFQGDLVHNLLAAFRADASIGGFQLRNIFDAAFEDLRLSVEADGGTSPDSDSVFVELCAALEGDDVVVSEVNSDNDVAALLNADAELHLRTPFNIFIGGNILDRGITIPNLISFYYGRNPKKMQADTVLQHSRMYGARNHRDLAVTRFYTSRGVHERLATIDKFEGALRSAFETGAHDRGVAFIQTDADRRIVPCAPNKILMTDTVSIDAGGRLLPVGFAMHAMSRIRGHVAALDALIPAGCADTNEPAFCDISTAHDILNLIAKTMDVSATAWDWNALSAVIDYFCRLTAKGDNRDKIWIAAYTGRGVQRTRAGGRFSDAPDTKQQRDLAEQYARDIPMLLLFKQEGLKSQGWTDQAFWWPVLIAPHEAMPCVYAADVGD